jgi:FkbM family methyltransferase
MARERPSPTPKYPGVITMSEFADVVLRFIPLAEVQVVMDLGAMDGGDTLELQRFFPNARTIAVEGLPSNFERHLSWLNEIESHCAVIGNREGQASFFEKSVNGVHGLYERESDDTVGVLMVRTETLESFCRRIGVEGIDVLKIDVEGGTLDILEGAGDLLDRMKALHVETESAPLFRGQRLDDEVTRFLSARSFRMVWRLGRQAVAGPIVCQQYDSVWIHRRYCGEDR